MGLSAEQLTMVMGFDGREAERGLNAMLAKNAENAAKTRAIWAEADRAMEAEHLASVEAMIAEDKAQVVAAEKLAAEELAIAKAKDAALLAEDIESSSRRNKARALYRERDEAAALAQAKVNAEISAGSGAFDAAGVAGGAMAAAKFGKAAEGAAVEMHGMSAIIREVSVVIHEVISGRLKQALGSMIRLTALVGGSTALVGTALVAAGLAAVVGPSAYRTYEAYKGEKQSEKDLSEKEKQEGESIRKRVEDLQRAGLITEKQADAYREQIGKGQTAQVAIATNAFLQSGTIGEVVKKAEDAKKIAAIQAKTTSEAEEDYENASPENKRNHLWFERYQLQQKINSGQLDAVQTAQALYDIGRLTKEVNAADLEVDKKKSEEAEKKKEHDRETFELNKQYQHETMESQRKQSEIDNIGFEAPTIAQLAGRSYNARLDRAFGKGGRYDLERGDGPFGRTAREAELAAKQQMWDVIHGNAEFSNVTDDKGRVIGQRLSGGAAYDDLQRRNYAENQLRAAGLDTPQMKANRMAEAMDAINSNIAELNERSKHDGIVINTGTQ